MTNEEKALREKLGITDPLQLLPVGPDEKAQQVFKSKISDDILSTAMPRLTKEQVQVIRDRKKIAIEGKDSTLINIDISKMTRDEVEEIISNNHNNKVVLKGSSNMLPPIDKHLPEIKYHQEPTKIIRQNIKTIASSDNKKVSFSERFKDVQKRIESETNNSVSVSSPPIKLK